MAWGRRKKKHHPKKPSERPWNGYLSEVGPHVDSLRRTAKLQGGRGAHKAARKHREPPHLPTLSSPAGEDRKGTYSDTLKRLGGDHKQKDKNDLINNWTSSENTQETSSHEADENVSETSY